MVEYSLTNEVYARLIQPGAMVNWRFPARDGSMMHVVPAKVEKAYPKTDSVLISYLHAGDIRRRFVPASSLSKRRDECHELGEIEKDQPPKRGRAPGFKMNKAAIESGTFEREREVA